MNINDPACKSCRHWHSNDEDFEQGKCKRFPPVLIGRDEPEPSDPRCEVFDLWGYPETAAHQFCGEWISRDE